jgi:hypothetical protein
VGKPALDTGVPTVDRSVESGSYRGDRVLAYLDIQAAAHAAVAAGGAGDRLDRPQIMQTWLEDGTCGARVGTAAAADARRVDPAVAGAGQKNGVRAAAGQRQRVVPWTSSHIRTQCLQEIHRSGSKCT